MIIQKWRKKQMSFLRINMCFLISICIISSCTSKYQNALKCDDIEDNEMLSSFLFKADSNDIDSASVLFVPNALEIASVACSYMHPENTSLKVSISNRQFLDSLKLLIETLVPNKNDSLHVSSDINCKIFFHNNTTVELNLGAFFGTCYCGVIMKDNIQLNRLIKREIGFYKFYSRSNQRVFNQLRI